MPEREQRPGTTITNKVADKMLYPEARLGDEVLGEDLTEKMIRRPIEADFEEVLTPEGIPPGDITGTDVSDTFAGGNTPEVTTG